MEHDDRAPAPAAPAAPAIALRLIGGRVPTGGEIEQFAERGRAVRARVAGLAERAQSDAVPAPHALESIQELQSVVEELQVAEEELRLQNEEIEVARESAELERARYEDLFQNAPDGYVVTDASGTVHEANRTALELLDSSRSFAIGKPMIIFVDAGERGEFRRRLNELRDRDLAAEWLVRMRPRERAPFPAAVRVSAVRGRRGELLGLRWLVRDVSDRARADEAMRAINEQLEQRVGERTRLLAAADHLKAELLTREREARRDAEGAQRRLAFLAGASTALAELLDVRAAAATVVRLAVPTLGDWCVLVQEEAYGEGGRLLVEIAHDDPARASLEVELRRRFGSVESLPPVAARVLRGGNARATAPLGESQSAPAARDAQQLRELRELHDLGFEGCIAAPLVARGRTFGVITLLSVRHDRHLGGHDVALTEDFARRAAVALDNARLFRDATAARADAERASQSKTSALALLSHELRTPLNAISGYADLLEMGIYGAMSPKQLEAVVRIRRGHDHLLALFDNVLSFARLERGHIELDVGTVAVDELLAGCVQLVESTARAKELRLTHVPGDPAGTVLADAGKLRQIVINLLSNAMKFTPPGGSIAVDWEATPDDVTIHVHDSGRGIQASKLDAIFEPFVQIDRGRSQEASGTGLGLTISRDFARAMGGSLTVISIPGCGSTFSVTLPRPQAGAR